mgnify:CR=1 FL=1
MNIEIFRLNETIASRLTTSESIKFSKLVSKFSTTKSELIRFLIVEFVQKSQTTNQLLNTKK